MWTRFLRSGREGIQRKTYRYAGRRLLVLTLREHHDSCWLERPNEHLGLLERASLLFLIAAVALARALLPVVAYVLVMVICVDRERAELIILLGLALSWSGSTEVFWCLPRGRGESFAAQPGSRRRRLIFGV